jgi:heme oxygenase
MLVAFALAAASWAPSRGPALALPSRAAASRIACPAVLCAAVEGAGAVPRSFVGTEMRAAAMKLHTRDQAPREGQQPAQTPVSAWEPGKLDYLQFLVDSRAVYRCFETIVAESAVLASFRASGLERGPALDTDIAWFEAEGLTPPDVAAPGASYVQLLEGLARGGELEALVCHFYNHYFAHTAGGIQIGKSMSDKLLGGRTLEFYRWEGDVKQELLPALRAKIDAMAAGWTREQKDACLAQTAASFKYSGGLLGHLRAPASSRAA